MGLSLENIQSNIWTSKEKKEPSTLAKIGAVAGGVVAGAILAHYGIKKAVGVDIFSEILKNNKKSTTKIDIDRFSFPENQTIVTLPKYNVSKNAVLETQPIIKAKEVGHNIQIDEREYYSSIIDDFESLNPIRQKADPWTETESIIQRHINEDKSEIMFRLDRYAERKPDPTLELITDNGRLSCSGQSFYGDKALIAVFYKTYNCSAPSFASIPSRSRAL